MKLLFKQRFFSWFDSYDIFDEDGNIVYVVKGKLSWGHCLKIFDARGNELGMVKEKIITLLPKFEIYANGKVLGSISRELTLFKPAYHFDFNGWRIQGNFVEWNYTISDHTGSVIATISKQLLRFTDTYVLDIKNSKDALYVLMFALAIDAEKCTREKINENNRR